MSDLVWIGEEAHDSSGRVLVGVHKASHDADQTSGDHRRSLDPWLDTCGTETGESDKLI